MALLVVGCTVVDVIFPRVARLPVWPEHTEFTTTNLTLLAEPPLITIGGNGANAAYVAARCGATVTLHSNDGHDWFGDQARRWLETAGCQLKTSRRNRRTAVNVTAADRRLRRATLFYPGARSTLPASARGCSHVLVCGWPHPTPAALTRSFRRWQKLGTRTVLDVGPILGVAPTLKQLRGVLASLDLFIGNAHEVQAIARAKNVRLALKRLRETYAGDVVIKLGARGALWLPAEATVPTLSPGKLLRAVNTVGAGDTFNGALLAALDRGQAMPAALEYANRAAASVVRSAKGVLGLQPPSRTN